MNKSTASNQILSTMLVRTAGFFIGISILLFLPAGSLKFWQAWMYMITMTSLMLVTLNYLAKNDPALLERRTRLRERESQQRNIIGLSVIFLLLVYILPGLDQRYQWSQMPAWIAILGDAIVAGGYLLVVWVFRTNTFTSRIVEVETNQKVISTGPYAIVRHPMYVGAFLTYAASPLALGSYWAVLPGLMMLPVLILRILNEEKLLLRDLDGYRAYTQKVKYRLLPGLW